jgi:hypothetical protein
MMTLIDGFIERIIHAQSPRLITLATSVIANTEFLAAKIKTIHKFRSTFRARCTTTPNPQLVSNSRNAHLDPLSLQSNTAFQTMWGFRHTATSLSAEENLEAGFA